jgi:glycosyltransferase involved in cell wall biosynthesis
MDAGTYSFGLRMIGWIYDFQHVYLPQFFSEATRRYRDSVFRLVAQRTTLVLLSSHVALEHFSAFAPDYAYKGRVFQFPSMFGFKSFDGDPSSTLRKFRLPQKFALVANQFWQHKNHLVVIQALERLRCQGVEIPLVMTGLPVDKRDPANENLSRILQAVASAGLANQVTILGMVPEADLNNLMCCAALVIQPSRFEGWSTPVQEAKALGRPLICSDIPVHHEQAPGALGFFPCDGPDALADLVADNWNRLDPGPDPQNEKKALAVEREFAEIQGRLLLNLCLEAAAV